MMRDERPAQAPLAVKHNPGPEIAISLAAYERAFEPKLRWEAGACDARGTLALPPRHRCLGCGSESGWTLTPLPRAGEVYTGVTVHIPVPGLPTPYSLVIVDLDGVDVRALVKVTGVPAATTAIGDRGSLVATDPTSTWVEPTTLTTPIRRTIASVECATDPDWSPNGPTLDLVPSTPRSTPDR